MTDSELLHIIADSYRLSANILNNKDYQRAADILEKKAAIQEANEYREKLEQMDEEQLGYEFSDRIGNELLEFEQLLDRKGKEFIIDYLTDNYEVKHGM